MMIRYAIPFLAALLGLTGLGAAEQVLPVSSEQTPAVLVVSNTTLALLLLSLWLRRKSGASSLPPVQWACRCPHCGQIHMHKAADATGKEAADVPPSNN